MVFVFNKDGKALMPTHPFKFASEQVLCTLKLKLEFS